jgi:vacuolar-type H+-ATPase subunit F/Vma7
MRVCAFMGDEVSAAGFRLAGVDVHVPGVARAAGLFRQLLEESQLILLTAEVAAWLPQDLLTSSLRRERPLVLVIPDIRGRTEPADLSLLLRRQLGMVE